jgi:hypothetical protein
MWLEGDYGCGLGLGFGFGLGYGWGNGLGYKDYGTGIRTRGGMGF